VRVVPRGGSSIIGGVEGILAADWATRHTEELETTREILVKVVVDIQPVLVDGVARHGTARIASCGRDGAEFDERGQGGGQKFLGPGRIGIIGLETREQRRGRNGDATQGVDDFARQGNESGGNGDHRDNKAGGFGMFSS